MLTHFLPFPLFSSLGADRGSLGNLKPALCAQGLVQGKESIAGFLDLFAPLPLRWATAWRLLDQDRALQIQRIRERRGPAGCSAAKIRRGLFGFHEVLNRKDPEDLKEEASRPLQSEEVYRPGAGIGPAFFTFLSSQFSVSAMTCLFGLSVRTSC